MPNLNKILIMGNLTRDPEIRHTPKGTAVAELGIAINRVWNNEQGQKQEETTFVDVTLWGRQAEVAHQYLAKGRPVYIEGRLQMDTWDDKTTGQKRTKMKIVGESLQLLGSKPDGAGNDGGERNYQRPSNTAPKTQPQQPADDYQEDDDIPF